MHTGGASPPAFRPEDVACVIEVVEILDLTALNNAYCRITAAKAFPKPPLPKSGTELRTDRTLGVILARSSTVALDAVADE
jgi:hypothetical protein